MLRKVKSKRPTINQLRSFILIKIQAPTLRINLLKLISNFSIYEVHMRHFLISPRENIMIVLAQLKKILFQDSKMKIFSKIFKGLMAEEGNTPICKIFNPSLKIYLVEISEDLVEKVEIKVLRTQTNTHKTYPLNTKQILMNQ